MASNCHLLRVNLMCYFSPSLTSESCNLINTTNFMPSRLMYLTLTMSKLFSCLFHFVMLVLLSWCTSSTTFMANQFSSCPWGSAYCLEMFSFAAFSGILPISRALLGHVSYPVTCICHCEWSHSCFGHLARWYQIP